MVGLEGVRLVRAGKKDAGRLAEVSKRAFHSDVHSGMSGEGVLGAMILRKARLLSWDSPITTRYSTTA